MNNNPPIPRITQHEPLGWQGFALKKHLNNYYFQPYRDHDNRNSSTLNMIVNRCTELKIPDFDWLLVCVQDLFDWETNSDDLVIDAAGRTFEYLCYHTTTKNFARVIPDYCFDHWQTVGIDDYEQLRLQLSSINQPAERDMIGWRGASNMWRQPLIDLDDKINFDCEEIKWNHSNPKKLTATNYLSFLELATKYRFLIDVRGRGWSGRLKLLLCAPRVTFIVQREFEEFFFPYLEPWQHYVPVKQDFSDLSSNLARVRSDQSLENYIIDNVKMFASEHLTRQHALDVVGQKLQRLFS